jgi:prenylcysteine alpha-carboxyl methylesterase
VHRMDIYVPGGPVQGGSKPVIMFVHGGVWASGDKWQFSPLGSQLAQDGVIAVVVQYTLFPQVLAEDQVSEVSQALTWTMDNIQNYGGHPRKIYVMGHSSGILPNICLHGGTLMGILLFHVVVNGCSGTSCLQ